MAKRNLDLVLAVDDRETREAMWPTRIAPPEERGAPRILEMIRGKIVEAEGELGVLRYRARMEAAADGDAEQLQKLEGEFLTQDEYLRMGVWPVETPYLTIDEAVILKDFVVRTYRPRLAPYRIAVVFQESIPPHLRTPRLGTATKLAGKMMFLSGLDAVITIDFTFWRQLSDKGRQRLMHHELCHLDVNPETSALRLVPHDIEEFRDIYLIYGLESEDESMDDGLMELFRHAETQFDMLREPVPAYG